MRHIISVLLENEFGALSRVAGLFSARGFNIESLTVAPTNDPTLSRMTIVSMGDDAIIEQIIKQTNKLVDVVKVSDLTAEKHIERELLLLKVSVEPSNQADIDRIIDEYGCKIVDVSENTYTIELAGQGAHVDSLIEEFEKSDVSNILEVARTGVTGVSQG
jgi:acetolactate synthase-1/3 small subunit